MRSPELLKNVFFNLIIKKTLLGANPKASEKPGLGVTFGESPNAIVFFRLGPSASQGM